MHVINSHQLISSTVKSHFAVWSSCQAVEVAVKFLVNKVRMALDDDIIAKYFFPISRIQNLVGLHGILSLINTITTGMQPWIYA